MSTPLSKIYNIFLNQIEDDILALVEREVVEDMLMVYLHGATVEFTECSKDLTIVEPSESNGFEGFIVSDLDLDEIFILANGMILYWLKPKILREDNLKTLLTDSDYNQKSPANMLQKLISLKSVTEEDFENRKIKYTYKDFKGWD